MDGDEADLRRLVTLKQQYDNVLLYVDEAHAVGVRGIMAWGVRKNRIVWLTSIFYVELLVKRWPQ